AVISPGPAVIVALRVAARDGARAALFVAVGLGFGAVTWAAAALLGLTALFSLFPELLTALRIGGAIFLLFLAWMIWRAADNPISNGSEATAATRTRLSAVRLGFLTQVSNPKAAVFFSAVFIGLPPPGLDTADIALLLAVILSIETIWYAIVALLFSRGPARRVYGRIKSGFERLLGGALAALGIKIALG
ncbi:MAG: LysE family transporter, partial [Pseudomonadota bacterium]